MAITVPAGVEGSVSDSAFALMLADGLDLKASHGVMSGLGAELATADRTLNLAAGRALTGGASWVADAPMTPQFAANSSGQKRLDLLCAQTDWAAARQAFLDAGGEGNLDAASAAAQAAAGSLVIVQGTPGANPIAPFASLTRTPGTLWQEPLWQQPIRSGVGQFAAGTDDPVDVRRLRQPDIDHGTIVVTPAQADQQKFLHVPFTRPFAEPPEVLVSLGSIVSGYNIVDWQSAVTTTGFNVNLLRGSTTPTTIAWVAVGVLA